MRRLWLSWSSGKDSAWALHQLRRTGDAEVAGLLTTLTGAFQRVAMHGVRRRLVEAQAEAAGLPLHIVELPWPCSNGEYEARLEPVWGEARQAGIDGIAFGDLFLEDVREYRVRQLAGTGLEALFPLWGRDTAELARDIVGGGVRAKLACVDPTRLDPALAGRDYDAGLLEELPADVDPCGENGEFHTVVCGGPVFDRPLELVAGEVVERDGFVFADFRGRGS